MLLCEMNQTQQKLLLVVHPGSACGSADMNLGRYQARADRDGLMLDFDHWHGSVLVIDGDFSDEMHDAHGATGGQSLGQSLDACLARASASGQIADRVYGDDNNTDNWEMVAAARMKELGLLPSNCSVLVTGAWFTPDHSSGCGSSMVTTLAQLGYNVQASDNGVMEPDEDENEEGWDDEEDNDEQIVKEYEEDEDDEEFSLPEYILPAGTLLYHGTSGDFDASYLDGPAWVSNDVEPAEYFAKRFDGEGKARVSTFKLDRDLKLAVMDKEAFETIEDHYGVGFYGTDDADDFLRVLRQIGGFEGWTIPDNYGPDKADILIKDTGCLSHVKTDLVESLNETYIKPRRRSLYLYGHCFRLAVALHDKTGWPLVGIRAYGAANPDFSLIDHAAVRMPNGMYLDGRGVLDDNAFLRDMQVEGGGPIEIEDLTRSTAIDLQRHAGDAISDRMPDSVIDRDADRLIQRANRTLEKK